MNNLPRAWNVFLSKSDKSEFEEAMAEVLSEGTAKIDELTDEELLMLGRS